MAVERINGVIAAEFSFEEALGVVTFDPTLISQESIIRELHRMTGFEADVVRSADDSEGS